MKNLIRALRAVIKLLRPQAWGPFVEISEMTSFDHAFGPTYSQGGEDIALINCLAQISSGRYIDIGCHHPSRFSVTRLLYQMGWSGVNVDANRSLINEFNKKRKRDINICALIGMGNEQLFTIFEEPALSTSNQEWVEKFLREKQSIRDSEMMVSVKLRTIYEKYFPDTFATLLAIDAEGSDLNVLESLELAALPSARHPKWILLEADPPVENALKAPAVAHALVNGYEAHLVLSFSTLLKKKSD